MKTLPLTVLVYEGPSARSYLLAMKAAGFMPRNILLMVMSHHASNGKPIGRFLPRGIRISYCQKVQDLNHNFWPRQIAEKHTNLVEGIGMCLGSVLPGASGLLKELTGPSNYSQYCENLDRVIVKDLKDRALAEALTRYSPGAVLYTGGGLVPRSLLELEGLRFLHIHPGYLPNVRGADCLMWSMLLRGKPGASCFYMASGIDVGHIIAKRDFPPLVIPGYSGLPDDDTLYRTLFSFFDPMLRAILFVQDVLPLGEDLTDLPSEPQDESQGVTYHFMHKDLLAVALRTLFREKPPKLQ